MIDPAALRALSEKLERENVTAQWELDLLRAIPDTRSIEDGSALYIYMQIDRLQRQIATRREAATTLTALLDEREGGASSAPEETQS